MPAAAWLSRHAVAYSLDDAPQRRAGWPPCALYIWSSRGNVKIAYSSERNDIAIS